MTFTFSQISHFTAVGQTLNAEEKTTLAASLTQKQAEEKFTSIKFWGKITSIQRDYYIAQATTSNNYFTPKNMYSFDLTTWLQFPSITDEEYDHFLGITGRFVGDAGFEYPFEKSVFINNLETSR